MGAFLLQPFVSLLMEWSVTIFFVQWVPIMDCQTTRRPYFKFWNTMFFFFCNAHKRHFDERRWQSDWSSNYAFLNSLHLENVGLLHMIRYEHVTLFKYFRMKFFSWNARNEWNGFRHLVFSMMVEIQQKWHIFFWLRQKKWTNRVVDWECTYYSWNV